MTNILSFLPNSGAYTFYRILQPAIQLQEELTDCGIEVVVTAEPTREQIDKCDVLSLHGMIAPDLIGLVRDINKTTRIVWNTDDAWSDLPPWNLAYDMVGFTELELLKECQEMSHRIVMTTDKLKDYYPTVSDKTIVCPNLIDMDDYPAYAPRDMNTCLYASSQSHYEDADILGQVVDASNRNFIFFQTMPLACTDHIRVPEGLKQKPKKKYGKRVGHIPTAQFGNYQSFMCSIQFGIGLAPLVDCRFNHHKSILKMLEYAGLGCPTIASNVSPYTEVMTDDIGRCVSDNPQEWIQAMDEMTPEHGENAYNWVKDNYSWSCEDKRKIWLDMYKEIVS